jgi:hypothetical protein
LQKALTSQAVWIEDEECKGVDNRRVEGALDAGVCFRSTSALRVRLLRRQAHHFSAFISHYFLVAKGATSAHHACWGTPLLNTIGVALPLASKWVAGPSSWGGGNPV